MKPTLIFKLLALSLALCSCIQEKTTRVNADGSTTETQSWRPTERAGELLGDVVRDRLRLKESEIHPSK